MAKNHKSKYTFFFLYDCQRLIRSNKKNNSKIIGISIKNNAACKKQKR